MKRKSTVCLICGDRARGYNFGVISCIPCKAFFQRHALRPPGSLICKKNNNCMIDEEYRSKCSACRLEKCLLLGMKRESFRNYNAVVTTVDWRDHLPLPEPIDFSEKDRSMVMMDQSTLLSNVIHLHDRRNSSQRLHSSIMKEQIPIPVKSRLKSAPLVSLIFESVQRAENLIKDSNRSRTLCGPTPHRLLKNNFLQNKNSTSVVHLDKCLEVTPNKNFDVTFEN